MTLLILGAGESGTGAAMLAQKKGLEVFVSDSRKIGEKYKAILQSRNIAFEENGHSRDQLFEATEIIKSPGIPNDIEILMELSAHGTPIKDEIEFAARYTTGKIIAITGSNGKSTTASLIYHLLKENGLHVALVGNIGYSFAKCIADYSAYDYYVAEVSSFQLENIRNFRPHIACLLNITPDHLDRYHYSLESYAEAKLNILRNMGTADYLVCNEDDTIIRQAISHKQILPQVYSISMKHTPGLSAYVCKRNLYFKVNNKICAFSKDKVPLAGVHNILNTMVATTTALLLGLPTENIVQALSSFKGLPHRLEWCGTFKEVDFYNDSKATNVASAAVALQSFIRPIIWIAGGLDKGNDYQALLEIVRKNVKGIICVGKNNRTIFEAFASLNIPFYETDNMATGVEKAILLAKANDLVLLSPACASFDLFENYIDRGNQFKAAVQQLFTNERTVDGKNLTC